MISIIVPVYNGEKYLSRCIQSIICQTEPDFELLLIDDGSEDSSPSICDAWAQKDARVKSIHQVNAGVSSARNTGLRSAMGDYTTFVDCDDWVEEDFLEKLYKTALDTNADIICCNRFNEGNRQTVKYGYQDRLLTGKEALDCYSVYYFTAVWGKLFRSSCIADLYFREDIFYSEDTLFYTQAVMKASSVFWMTEALYHYYTNPSGAMGTMSYERGITDFLARRYIANLYSEYPDKHKGAVCRAYTSAIRLSLIAQKEKTNTCTDTAAINKYIKDNRWVYLTFSKIPLAKRVFAFICSFKAGKLFIRMIRQIKHRIS